MYKKISDYAVIGNLHSIAMVGMDGSIDWLCLPHIDSPSVFGALLDDQKGGRFAVTPKGEWDSVAQYLPDTNVLITKFRTGTGILRLTDFMPVYFGEEEEIAEERHELYRLIEITKGEVETLIIFEPRFDYARAQTILEKHKQRVVAKGSDEALTLSTTYKAGLDLNENRAEALWSLKKGDKVWLYLNYGIDEGVEINRESAEKSLQRTIDYWQSWLRRSETGRIIDLGPYKDMVNRSALTLKLLYYSPTGTISAAATTSLPESIGGIRNWDYRCSWIRDTSFTVQALFDLGHISETEGYLKWAERLPSQYGTEGLQIMYGLRGEKNLPEIGLTHLDGYKGSMPVRIGNAASGQKQLDIYGEIMNAALKLSDYVGKIDTDMWPFLRGICDYVVDHWHDKDHGIWEMRCGPYHFVHSKVMCWAALDRGITIARRYGFLADVKKWEQNLMRIKEEILEKGFNERKQAFVQHYDTDALDAGNLLIPILGFLPYDDYRVVSTLEATMRELGHNGFLYRYKAEDGLPQGEGIFLVCTFWLVDNLIALARFEEAEEYLHRIECVANHVGLFSEEYDPEWAEQLGNFPQAYTHIGYISSVVSLARARGMRLEKKPEEKKAPGRLLLSSAILLNEGEPRPDIPSQEIASRLKNTMNIMRGIFFDTKRGRIAYEKMEKSKAYQDLVELSYTLKKMGLNTLERREEKLAFWINIYNVMVIHGVIELGIRDSVREVRNFFKRVQYRIDDMIFSLDDIEHGILRGNSHPPYSLFRQFKENDRRLKFIIQPVDPRIHFALVCASSSCPPIDVYKAESIDKQLDIAAKTFLNAGGIIIEREKNRILLSKIFKWYATDFGKNQAERLMFIARYIYSQEDKNFLSNAADQIRVDYQDYDWRLNK